MEKTLLTSYWKFFGSHTFTKGSKICFWNNGGGGFAISSNNTVTIYNDECVELKSFMNAYAFETGFVAVVCSSGEVKIYSAYANEFVATLTNCNAHKYFRCTDHAFIAADNVTEKFFFYRPGKQPVTKDLPYSRIIDFDTTFNGLVYIRAEGNDPTEQIKYLFDKNDKQIECEKFAIVNLLKCGSYVILDSLGCNLFNENNQKILHSDTDFGIRDLGGYYVAYENVLVINAEDGRILREFKSGEQIVTPYLMSVSPYKLSSPYGSGYWLESQGMNLYRAGANNFVGYWHDGKFYFIADTIEYSVQNRNLFSMSDISEEQRMYKEVIASMILLQR
jgi:hypothetical protein